MAIKSTILHNMAVFVGAQYKIGVADVVLPNWTQKVITKHFAGTAGEIEIPTGVRDVASVTINSADLEYGIIEQMGGCSDPIRVVIRSIEKDVLRCDRDNHLIVVQGIWTQADMGSLKVGEESTRSYKLSIRRYRHVVNGKEVINYNPTAPDPRDKEALGL